MLKVTTSWDDGDILDTRLSKLLDKYHIKGTFYISKSYRAERLSNAQITEIAKTNEIGAHTITHPDLRIKGVEEILESKKWLQDLLNTEIKMFCYPKGFFDNKVIQAVKEAGFLGARTTELALLNISDPYRMPTTIQVYPFPFRTNYLRKIFEPYQQRASGLKTLGVSSLSMYSWLSMVKATFDTTLEKDGVFHLWGHSWEIDKYDMWNDLEKFLQYITNRKNCVYLTNSEALT